MYMYSLSLSLSPCDDAGAGAGAASGFAKCIDVISLASVTIGTMSLLKHGMDVQGRASLEQLLVAM